MLRSMHIASVHAVAENIPHLTFSLSENFVNRFGLVSIGFYPFSPRCSGFCNVLALIRSLLAESQTSIRGYSALCLVINGDLRHPKGREGW